ncbi:cation:proton antiporter [Lacticaseibacillus brantae]|uniref:Na(+) H(+) antiporter n=1 Tax=Lacticaseibacillus brantae DSM 23927 TaxID=1423727 RepID=A0A0R2B1X2_9LACO|nr:sodium:proton antiporter [Lacticaseibacillus brantae]KRM71972.1 Na(+) H(+) antiporter [Lacticaseibacillus brantae DSM 23927]
MTIILDGLVIVGLIILAQIIQRFVPKVPLPLIEILLGVGLGLTNQNFALKGFNSELFLLGVIAPLMFNDGQNTSRRALSRNMWNVLMLSVGLVLVTVLIVAGLTAWLIPTLGFWTVFVLASVLSPTDATAVNGITQQLTLPERLTQILEGESLLNDATGIVIFDFGLTVIASGQVAIGHGISEFLIEFFGGLILGFALGYLVVWFRLWLQSLGLDQSAIMVPIQLATPFVVYLIGNQIGVSGILAVVAAGLVHGLERDRLRMTSTRLQVVTTTVWQVVSDMLNGLVFVLLGLILPLVFHEGGTQWLRLSALAFAIYAVMLLVRFVFVRFTLNLPLRLPRNLSSWLVAMFGSHGTMTLALALSLPLNFPERSQLLVVAALVILFSLIVPTILAPVFVPAAPAPVGPDEATARQEMLASTAEWLKHQPDTVARAHVQGMLQEQSGVRLRFDRTKLRALLAAADTVERAAIKAATDSAELPAFVAPAYNRYLAAQSGQYNSNIFRRMLMSLLWQVMGVRLRGKIPNRGQATPQMRAVVKNGQSAFLQAETIGYNAVMAWTRTGEETPEMGMLATMYQQRHSRFLTQDDLQAEENSLYVQAFQVEYQYIDNQLRQKLMTNEVAKALREQISYDQMVYMQQH